MGELELFAFAVGLSMDAFAVSVCKGLRMKMTSLRGMATCGVWFGGFQALMTLAGFYAGSVFASAIDAVEHWIAFILLALIGANLIREALGDEKTDVGRPADFSVRTMFALAVATSIDAFAAGISLAMLADTRIWPAIILIGCTTFAFSALGVRVGSIFGSRFEKGAQIAGGIILILLGIKILLEHLGVY